MKYIKSFQIFENKNNPEVISYLQEILDTLKLDGFKVDVAINEPSLFLRGFARVVGAGRLPDINIHIGKPEGLRYDEISPYVNHIFSYLTEQRYEIHGLSVGAISQGRNQNGFYRYGVDLVYVKGGKLNDKIPGYSKERIDWVSNHMNDPSKENLLVKSVSISFIKS